MNHQGIITVFDGEASGLWYHQKEGIIRHQLKRFVYGEDFRNVLRGHLELIKTHKLHKILSDDRKNGPLTPEDAEWTQANYKSQVVALGLQHWAVVMPELVLGQMNMRRRIKAYSEMGVNAKAFTDPDEAFGWLAAQT